MDVPYRRRFGIGKHSKVEDVVEVVGEQVWKEYLTFTFVRNPYDRITSWYMHAKSSFENQNFLRRKIPFLYKWFGKPEKWNYPVVRAYHETDSFGEFLRHDGCIAGDGMSTQHDWISREGETDLDYVGKVETMKQDFEEICAMIGVQAEISRENVSKRKSYREFYKNEEDARIVEDRYEKDFRAFGYDMGDV